MKNYSTRLFSLILAALIFTTGCSTHSQLEEQTNSSSPETSGEMIQDAEETAESETEIPDDLPETDLGGTDVHIMIRTEFAYEFVTEGTAEVVDAALNKRELEIEDRFGVNIEYAQVNGNWGNKDNFHKHLENSVVAGTRDYDLVGGAENQLSTYAPEGLFNNLYDIENLNLTKPWWSQLFVENITYDNKLFLITGDIALTALDNMYVLFFNKQLAESYNMESPYDLVHEGKWTHDTMTSLITSLGVTKDVNGDGNMTEDDQYGWLSSQLMTCGFVSSYNMPITEFDEEGKPYMTFFNESMVDKLDKLSAFIHNSGDVFFVPNGSTEETTANLNKIFTTGHALFMTQSLGQVALLRELEFDFGILPFPKYDELQDMYTTHMLETLTVFGVPSVVNDSSVSGLILEAMAAEGYKTVIPAYYDIALSHKYNRDQESEKMLDIIREGRYFNFGHYYTISLNGILTDMFTIFVNGENYVSAYKARQKQYTRLLETIVESYVEYDSRQ